jgi:hypothetical protein
VRTPPTVETPQNEPILASQIGSF